MPPYYNIKTPQPQNPKTVKDGALVSSEGYSYVTEVPSLPSSHQRHSNASKKSDGSHHSMREGGGSSGGGGGGGGSGSGHIERSESSHQHSRQRRTQRKITHNEKRYHSGKLFWIVHGMEARNMADILHVCFVIYSYVCLSVCMYVYMFRSATRSCTTSACSTQNSP